MENIEILDAFEPEIVEIVTSRIQAILDAAIDAGDLNCLES